jgi:hypothetical protein
VGIAVIQNQLRLRKNRNCPPPHAGDN